MKSGPRKTLRKGKKILKTIPVTWRVGKMVAKTMQVTRVRQVTWVLVLTCLLVKVGTIRKQFLNNIEIIHDLSIQEYCVA